MSQSQRFLGSHPTPGPRMGLQTPRVSAPLSFIGGVGRPHLLILVTCAWGAPAPAVGRPEPASRSRTPGPRPPRLPLTPGAASPDIVLPAEGRKRPPNRLSSTVTMKLPLWPCVLRPGQARHCHLLRFLREPSPHTPGSSSWSRGDGVWRPACCPFGTSQERAPSSSGPPDAAATRRLGSENGGTQRLGLGCSLQPNIRCDPRQAS